MASEFPRHLLDIESLRREEIEEVLKLSARFKRERAAARAGKGRVPRHDLLPGRTVVTLFFEASTRTRSSFEVAAHALGAEVLSFQKDASSVTKGESLQDTVRNLEAIGADVLVVRHPAAGAPRSVARAVRASVINAGDGAHEHPTQALLDALTLREKLGELTGKVISIVGDIAHSRVARSNVHCLSKLGARVRVAGPSTLIPAGVEKLGCEVARTLPDALRDADAVMMLRIQQERIADAHPRNARLCPRVGSPRAHAGALAAPGRGPAPRPGEPGGGAGQRGDGRRAQPGDGPGGQRRRGPHGHSGALPGCCMKACLSSERRSLRCNRVGQESGR